jgi:hypothetical protein
VWCFEWESFQMLAGMATGAAPVFICQSKDHTSFLFSAALASAVHGLQGKGFHYAFLHGKRRCSEFARWVAKHCLICMSLAPR